MVIEPSATLSRSRHITYTPTCDITYTTTTAGIYAVAVHSDTLDPQPDTLNPNAETPHPAPYALHPEPSILHPTPQRRKPTPQTLDRKPKNLNPEPQTPHPRLQTWCWVSPNTFRVLGETKPQPPNPMLQTPKPNTQTSNTQPGASLPPRRPPGQLFPQHFPPGSRNTQTLDCKTRLWYDFESIR